MPSTPGILGNTELRLIAPMKRSDAVILPTIRPDHAKASPVHMQALEESRDLSPCHSTSMNQGKNAPATPPRDNTVAAIESNNEEDSRRQAEEESIALARALMAEEAMAVTYHMSMDYLQNNRDQFSEEDLAALQAAMDDDEPEEVEEIEEDEDGGMSYEMMLRLGERLGDVKSERWSRVAREKINLLPTFAFDPEAVKDKDENDCLVKCLVCQFAYEKEDCLRRLRCNHCFHRDCVDQWLLSKDCCPYCRIPIVEDEE